MESTDILIDLGKFRAMLLEGVVLFGLIQETLTREENVACLLKSAGKSGRDILVNGVNLDGGKLFQHARSQVVFDVFDANGFIFLAHLAIYGLLKEDQSIAAGLAARSRRGGCPDQSDLGLKPDPRLASAGCPNGPNSPDSRDFFIPLECDLSEDIGQHGEWAHA
eukprot:maker-scaffold430_size173499-snap-gene-0.46 protein:Tk07009 transcript:maker-scaffold430_size173499-snap-gene-0.46-mRNA-1 annotation:"probable e3 ubiquitin-protein ligase dtx3-like"